MKVVRLSAILLIAFLFKNYMLNGQQLAFPGAEGFGKYTTGGRGGTVYHVTNLNDDGEGSFRDAVSEPNRIVVFDVGGVINIEDRIVINKNITVAGQTAPGGGITIYGNGIAFNDDSGNDIIRYIRIRMGKNGDSGKDAVGISAGQCYMFDHVSVSWGRDGTFDINGDDIDSISIQDCIIAQGINNSNHSTGGLMQSGQLSLIRTLFIDNKTRNPKGRGTIEYINNVIYNWSTNGFILGDTDGLSEVNIMGNYFISGPSTGSTGPFSRATTAFHTYISDNRFDSDTDGELNGSKIDSSDYGSVTFMTEPYDHPGVNTLLTSTEAYNHIVDSVGASLVRDAVDLYLINELTSLGTEGAIISTEDDNEIENNVGTVESGVSEVDTDSDGMPDKWEYTYGLNPNSGDDQNLDTDDDGYTNIEEYLNSTNPGQADGTVTDNAYFIFARHSDKVLDVSENSTAESVAIIQYEIEKDNSQIWNIAATGDYYSITNENSGLALTVETASSEDGAAVIQTTYTGAENQQWAINYISDGYYYVTNRNSGKCLEITDASTENSAEARQNTYSESTNQMFKIQHSVLYIITPDISLDSPTSGTSFNEGEEIAFEATAGDNDGEVVKVEFFANGTLLGEDTSSPYTYTWIDATAGDYELTATATDDEGLSATSSSVSISVVAISDSTTIIQENEIGFCSVDGSIDSGNEGFTGDGFANADNETGSGIDWMLNIPEDGEYTISWQYANGSSNRPGKLIVDDEDLVSNIDFATTDDWTTWSSVSVEVSLSAGIIDVRLESTESDGLANIDYIEINGDATASSCTGSGATGTLTMDWYPDIEGTAVTDLTGNDNFPANPSGSKELSSFEAPENWSDNFGASIRGYVHAESTGSYVFWIAANEAAELWLSTDEDPENAVKIAEVTEATDSQDWNDNDEQQSGQITLYEGEKYYIEALYKESDGDDHLSVAWYCPTFDRQLISSDYISPYTGDASTGHVNYDTSIEAPGSQSSFVNVYPNPVSDKISIELSGTLESDACVYLYNSLGQLTAYYKMESSNMTIEIGEINSPFIILKIVNGNNVCVKKLIK